MAVRVGMAYNDTPGRVHYAYKLAVGRSATPGEIVEATSYLGRAQLALKGSPVNIERVPRTALASYLRTLLSSDEFIFVD
ncbi:MAG: hypothetical protein H7Y20_13330 [Bryobacteraceae bacterium]|nr:hypothetical protein [Bryobacteraceae bacterium]